MDVLAFLINVFWLLFGTAKRLKKNKKKKQRQNLLTKGPQELPRARSLSETWGRDKFHVIIHVWMEKVPGGCGHQVFWVS